MTEIVAEIQGNIYDYSVPTTMFYFAL